jgi:hypothetical protein
VKVKRAAAARLLAHRLTGGGLRGPASAARRRRVPFALCLLAAGLSTGAVAAAASRPQTLCAPLSPTRTHLPAWLGVKLANYTYELNANARAHGGLCNIGLSSPSDGYAYNVDVEVFPSHALAVGDFGGLSLAAAYSSVFSKKSAPGFPAPDFELSGQGRLSGRPVSDVTFVDGRTLVSAYIVGPGTLARTLLLGKWAIGDITALVRAR